MFADRTNAVVRTDDGVAFDLWLPGVLPTRTMNSRGHWGAGYRSNKKVRSDVALMLAHFGSVRPDLPAVGTMTRVAPRRLDDDNAVSACKGCRDEIAAWLGLKTDRDPRVTWVVEQELSGKGKPGMKIRIGGRK